MLDVKCKVKTFLTRNADQTKEIAASLAKELLKTRPTNKAAVIALQGELGSGKTTFLQGFARGLGIKEKILSPTFVILKRFQVSSFPEAEQARYGAGRFQAFYHLDCYRLKGPREILALGFRKIIADPKNIVAVEWAERIRGVLPEKRLTIQFDFISAKQRRIRLRIFNFQ